MHFYHRSHFCLRVWEATGVVALLLWLFLTFTLLFKAVVYFANFGGIHIQKTSSAHLARFILRVFYYLMPSNHKRNSLGESMQVQGMTLLRVTVKMSLALWCGLNRLLKTWHKYIC